MNRRGLAVLLVLALAWAALCALDRRGHAPTVAEAPARESRLSDDGSTVTDFNAQLMWAWPSKPENWSWARDYCTSWALHRSEHWRLPTAAEVLNLREAMLDARARGRLPFMAATFPKMGWVWTGSGCESYTSQMRIVSLSTGEVGGDYKSLRPDGTPARWPAFPVLDVGLYPAEKRKGVTMRFTRKIAQMLLRPPPGAAMATARYWISEGNLNRSGRCCVRFDPQGGFISQACHEAPGLAECKIELPRVAPGESVIPLRIDVSETFEESGRSLGIGWIDIAYE